MKFLCLFILTLGAIYWLSEQKPPRVIASGEVYVIDGDTIDIADERYRLIGFDTPETYRPECDSERQRGDQATARLRALIDVASEVALNVQQNRDKYGRWLATLEIDGRDVGDILIGEGLARRYNGGKRQRWC